MKESSDTIPLSTNGGDAVARACAPIPPKCHRTSPIAGRCANTPAPRFIRLRDAPRYLGMDKNRFNREVRPALTHLPIGVQGVAFDRLELDAWAEDYIRRNGRHLALSERSKSWHNVNRPASPCGRTLGPSPAKHARCRRRARASGLLLRARC
jgi:hypothetical protein